MAIGTIIGAAGVALPALSQIMSQRRSQTFLGQQSQIIQEIAADRAALIEEAGQREFEAFIERANQVELQASREELNTRQQVLEFREQGRAAVASVRARAAGSGIEFDSGSPLEVAAEQAGRAEKLAGIAEMQAGFRANRLLFERDQLKKAGSTAVFAAKASARSTLLTAFAQAQGIRAQAPTDLDIFAGAAQSAGVIFNMFRRDQQASILGETG